MATNTVRLHRVLRSKPERVYRAFLDADAMAKWLPPNGFTGKVHQIDAKVGGTYKMSFTNFTNGESHSFGGKYLELVPNQRIPLHGPFRRSEPSRRDDHDHLHCSDPGRRGDQHHAGRHSRCNTARGVLPRLAGIAHVAYKARRSGDSGLRMTWRLAHCGANGPRMNDGRCFGSANGLRQMAIGNGPAATPSAGQKPPKRSLACVTTSLHLVADHLPTAHCRR